MYVTNSKGEALYVMVISDTNDATNPHVSLKTWDNVVKYFNELVVDLDTDSWYVKVINRNIDTENHTAHASMVCNHKGWGGDFFRVVTIKPAIAV